jgi:hypothetical protein
LHATPLTINGQVNHHRSPPNCVGVVRSGTGIRTSSLSRQR